MTERHVLNPPDDESSWRAVIDSGSPGRRDLRLRRPIDGHLLPAVVPEPAAAPDRRGILRDVRGGRAAGFRACRRCHPRTRRTRPVGARRSGAPACTWRTSTAIRRWRRWPLDSAGARTICSATSSGSSASHRASTRRPAACGRVKRRLRDGRDVTARCSMRATARAAVSTNGLCRSSAWRPGAINDGGAGVAHPLRDRRARRLDGCSSPRRLEVSARCRWVRPTTISSAA